MPDLKLKWFVLAVNALCVMNLAFNTTAMMNAIPSIQEQLSISPLIARWIVNSYILCGAVSILLGGCLGDVFGHFLVLFFALLAFALISLGLASCSSGLQMLCLRSLQGATAAVISAVALSSISCVFVPSQRAFAMTVWGGMVGLGFGLGPLLGGALTTLLGWRYLFSLIGAVMLIGVIGNRVFWKKYPVCRYKPTLDLKGALFLMGWMAPVVFMIMEGQHVSWLSPRWLCLMAFTVMMFWMFIRRMQRVVNPLLELSLLKNPQLIGSAVIFFSTIFALIAFLFFYNRFLQWPLLYHASAFQAGIWMLPLNLAMCVVALFASRLGQLIGYGAALAIGMFLLIVGLGWFAFFPDYQIGWLQRTALVVMGSGFGITFPLAPYMGLQVLPEESQGKGSGIMNTVNYLAGSLAISLGACIYLQSSSSCLQGCDTATRDLLLMGSEREILSAVMDSSMIVPLQQAACRSFSTLMSVIIAVCCIGLGSCKFLVKRKVDYLSKTG